LRKNHPFPADQFFFVSLVLVQRIRAKIKVIGPADATAIFKKGGCAAPMELGFNVPFQSNSSAKNLLLQSILFYPCIYNHLPFL